MDWDECYKKRIVKEISKDEDLINSLIKTSHDKFISASKLLIDEITASSKFSLMYDSLRELLEALALKHGYKIYNHECYTAFLKEILNENKKGEEFDEIRKTRNGINYYGKNIAVDDAEKVIEIAKFIREEVLRMLK